MSRYDGDLAVGIIGVGGMGARHAENLHELVAGAGVAAVADADRSRADSVAARYGAEIFDEPAAMVAADWIDAVVVASPDETHAPLALECVRQGTPMLCEKPLATSVGDAERIIAAESDRGARVVQVGFMRRFDPQHRAVADTIAAGDVGRPVLLKGWHRGQRIAPGVTSSFILFNSAVHDLDSVRWLLRQEIAEVYVRGVSTNPASDGVADLLVIQLSTAEGLLATLEVYPAAGYGYEVGVELVGEYGTVHIAPPDAPFVRRERARRQRIDGEWLSRFQTAYAEELVQWAQAVRDGVPAGPSAWDGYLSVLAADACLASLHSGVPKRVPQPERPVLYTTKESEESWR